MAKLKNYNGRYCESEYESAFIAFLQSVGWTYLPGNKIKRCYRDVLIADDFRAFITKANTDLLEEEIEQIYDTVRLVGAESDFATLHKVYKWMVDGIQFTPQSGCSLTISVARLRILFIFCTHNIIFIALSFSVTCSFSASDFTVCSNKSSA